MSSQWQQEALQKIFSESKRCADTHLLKIWLPQMPNLCLYLKDESTHITGSLKHRLARSLFLYGLCSGWINENTTIVEASSGSTAVAEAYFSHMLGLKFIAIMPKTVSSQKIKRLKQYAGEYVFVEKGRSDREIAQQLAEKNNVHFMDQFTFAERVVDWRGNNNIAESTLAQMALEPCPIPHWIICGAGTGGTASTFGRYLRYSLSKTKLCVVDPEDSILYDYYLTGNKSLTIENSSRIEGIGRSYVPASFMPTTIARMLKIPDAGSIAALYFLDQLTGLKFGPSTGAVLYGGFKLMAELHQHGVSGSIVGIAGDSGLLYKDTYYNETWLQKNNIDIQPYLTKIWQFYHSGFWEEMMSFNK